MVASGQDCGMTGSKQTQQTPGADRQRRGKEGNSSPATGQSRDGQGEKRQAPDHGGSGQGKAKN